MSFSQNDRITISLEIVSGPAKINTINKAKAQIAQATAQARALDSAHANLFTPSNDLIDAYHKEAQMLDGAARSSISEQDLHDAASRKIKNRLFPVDSNGAPWPHTNPHALIATGKDLNAPSTVAESTLVNSTLALIAKKEDADFSISVLKALLESEIKTIPRNDPNAANQENNNAAIESAQILIAALGKKTKRVAALRARLDVIARRLQQLEQVLGYIHQDASTGLVSSFPGLYSSRYSFMAMRVDTLNGSLTKLNHFQAVATAHDSMVSATQNQIETYKSLLPTSLLSANGNGTSLIHVIDPSFLNPGDQVYLYADGQEEIVRAVKSVSGNAVTLNDVVPAKYKAASGLRIYKDLT